MITQQHRRAFWDSVREGLQGTPPDFEHSIRLLAEIKGILLELIPAGTQYQATKGTDHQCTPYVQRMCRLCAAYVHVCAA